MDNQAFDTLEFDQFRQLLARYAQTPFGRRQLIEVAPLEDLRAIEQSHLEVTECAAYQREFGRIRITDMEDPGPILERLAVADTRLEPEEMLQLQSIISIGNALRQQFREARDRYRALASIVDQIPNLSAIHMRLRTTLLPSGEINEDASPELKRLRREVNSMRSRIYRHLESLLDQAGSEGAVRDEFVTVRNGRFVIPVRNDARGRVPGVVHGVSSSGATAFVEPLSTIEENNELVRLRELEEVEIAKILFALSENLRVELPNIRRLIGALLALDSVTAKANFALDYDCVASQMNLEGRLELVDARHPLLEQNLRQTAGQVVPISLYLDSKKSAMVISGPNAGGKTVVLKTTGLLSLIGQSGLHVPAKSALLPIFKIVLADIGDHQSIAANLSTFSSHITNISRMADYFSSHDAAERVLPALVMIDEVGTGTAPEEGAALGVAIVDYFRQRGALVLVSTHYNQLKFYASETTGVVNASVEFDEETLRPTYRLLTGVTGTSSGIEIARRLGLQSEILDFGTKTLDRKDLHQANFLKTIKAEAERWQELTAALESEHQAIAAKQQRIDSEFAAREREHQREFEQRMMAAISAFEVDAAQYIAQIKDPNLAAKLTKEREKRVFQLKKKAADALSSERASFPSRPSGAGTKGKQEEIESPLVTEFLVGDRVETELGQKGTVEEIKGDDIFVRIGVMRMKTTGGALKLIDRATKKKIEPRLPAGVNLTHHDYEDISGELNVIGCTTDEARDRVDKFLDRAFLANFDQVRMVHGMGTGRLREAIGDLLKAHPHVAKFHQAASSQEEWRDYS